MIKKIKNAALCTYLIEDLNGEDIAKAFYEKKLRKQIGWSLELKT